MALLSAALYWGCMQLALRVSGVAASQEYNSVAGMLNYPLTEIPLQVARTYWRFIRLMAIPDAAQPFRAILMNALLAALGIFLFLRRVRRTRPGALNVLLAVIAAGLLPFALNISFFLSKDVQHDLMIYAFVLLYLLILQFKERDEAQEARGRKPLRAAICVALGVVSLPT